MTEDWATYGVKVLMRSGKIERKTVQFLRDEFFGRDEKTTAICLAIAQSSNPADAIYAEAEELE